MAKLSTKLTPLELAELILSVIGPEPATKLADSTVSIKIFSAGVWWELQEEDEEHVLLELRV